MIKQTQTMTTSEWEIMRVIWTLGEATSRQIIQAMCAMCVGQALADVLATTPLSQDDITRLQAVLQDKYAQAPDHIACDCLPHQGEEEKIPHDS